MDQNLPPQQSFLPSKPVRYVLGIIALGILLYLIIPPIIRALQRDREVNYVSPETAQQSPDRDTDGDGIPDWQEILVGLDPKLVDSNDDGINDNTEFMKRKESSAQSNLPVETLEDLGTSGKLGLIIAESVSNLPVTASEQDFIDTVTEDVADYFESQKTRYYTYTKEDLITTLNGIEEKRAYYNALLPFMGTPYLDIRVILEDGAQALKTGTVSSEFKTQLGRTNSLRSSFASIPVPSRALDLHFQTLESIEFLHGVMEDITNTTDDVLEKARLSVELQNAALQLSTDAETLKQYVEISIQES